MRTLHSHSVVRQPRIQAPRSLITVHTLLRWSGAAAILAGILTIIANTLHPPRSFAALAHHAQHPSWEVIHVLAIVALVVSAFGVIGIYACQVEELGAIGFASFVATLAGMILMVGILVPDALIFPVLARDVEAAYLLTFPGPIIPGSMFTIYMAVSGLLYCIGSVVLFGTGAWRGRLPRWAAALVALGMVPLGFGALVLPGSDFIGAWTVGCGYLGLGSGLWQQFRRLHTTETS